MNWFWSLSCVAVLIVPACTGCGKSQPAEAEGRAVAEVFLKLIEAGQVGVAWDSATAEFKSAMGRERFVAEVAKAKCFGGPLEFQQETTLTIGDQSRSEFSFRAASGDTVRVLIGRESDSWKVDRVEW